MVPRFLMRGSNTLFWLLVICIIGWAVGSKEFDENERDAYYKWFGLTRKTFDGQELQRSYRRLARQYHPDKNDSPGAQEIFQKIAKAYDTLNDDNKRALYNHGGVKAVDGAAGGSGGQADYDFAAKVFESVFGNFFSGGGGAGGGGSGGDDGIFGDFFGHGGGRRRQPGRGPNSQTELAVSLETLFKGGSAFLEYNRIKVCGKCEGTGAADIKAVRPCHKCRGQGIRVIMEQLGPMFIQQRQVPCEECHGRGKIFDKPCKECDGQRLHRHQERLKIDIEPGTRDGEVLTFRGMSDEHPERQTGDLLVILRTKEHSFYQRDGINLYAQVPISLKQALLGFTISIPRLDGSTFTLKRSGITQTDHVETVKGMGMPVKGSKKRGDLFVKLKVILPTNLSAKQIASIDGFLPGSTTITFQPVEDPHDEL